MGSTTCSPSAAITAPPPKTELPGPKPSRPGPRSPAWPRGHKPSWDRPSCALSRPEPIKLTVPFHVRLSDGRHCQVRSLFRKVGVGGRRYIRDDCRLGSRDSSLGPPLKLAATRLVSGDLVVVASNTDPKIALAHYRRRWEIETLFAATKTRGFNLEDTHLVHPDRIGKLLA